MDTSTVLDGVQILLILFLIIAIVSLFLFLKVKNIKELSFGKFMLKASGGDTEQDNSLLGKLSKEEKVKRGMRLFDEHTNLIKHKMLSKVLTFLCDKKKQSMEVVLVSRDYSHVLLAFEVCFFACLEEAEIMFRDNHLETILGSSDLIRNKVEVYRRICRDRIHLYKCGAVDLNSIHSFADSIMSEMERSLMVVLKEVVSL